MQFLNKAKAGLLLVCITALSAAGAQQAPPPMSKAEIDAFAKVYVAINKVRDSIDAQLAMAKNKKPELQSQLQDALRSQIAEVLHHNGMTDAEYQRKTYLVSVDNDTRKMFDSTIAKLTGAPIPGQVVATGPPKVPVPAGAVGTHIGHVINGFSDTPDGMGLLPAAMAEARIAAQHATLAGRDPTNLANMQLHAGHVINACDPTIVPMGPGRGYGVKKAALGAANHIELAAKAPGASPNVVMHSVHVATAARAAADRADQVIAVAKQIQAATSAADAAKLVSQLASLADQLIKGVDANADGKITWEKGEGGLQQADEHVKLMLAGEK
ncbi:MAG TPA: DUF4168 domain-containing protein [Gemmatimonadaceae bacterium]|nr:DUF4168 domain-containing protein [Gemmatimonadaceae bacterium]